MNEGDYFTPEMVDEAIEQILAQGENSTPAQRLVQELNTYMTPPADPRALDHVWGRITLARVLQHRGTTVHSLPKENVPLAPNRKESQMISSSVSRKTGIVAKSFSILAMTIVLVSLVGGLALVLQFTRTHQNATHSNTTSTTSTSAGTTLYTFAGNTAAATDEVTHQVLWQHQFPNILSGKHVGWNANQVVNGIDYVWWGDPASNNTIYALNAKDGTVLWTFKTKMRVGGMFFSSGLLFFVNVSPSSGNTTTTNHTRSTLYALDAKSGTVKWQKPSTSLIGWSIADASPYALYAYQINGISSDDWYAFSPLNGSILWHQHGVSGSTEAQVGSGGAQVENGVLYVDTYNNDNPLVTTVLSAYNALNGHLQWRKQYNHDTWLSTIANGIVYMEADSPSDTTRTPDMIGVPDMIEAVSAQNGLLLWSYQATSRGVSEGVSSPSISAGHAFVTVVDEKGNRGSVVAFDAKTGHVQWTYNLALKPSYGQPVVVQNSVAVASGAIFILNQANGSLLSTIKNTANQPNYDDVSIAQ
jgi:outer membrane protein assembly factor BamB